MILLEFSMFPTSMGESKSAYVARILDIIDQSGVAYQLTPMGTILEGEWDQVNAVVTGCFKALEKDCDRVSINIRVDYRAGDKSRLKSKVESVEKIVGRTLAT